MSTVKLNTENGSVTLVPEDGVGNVNVAIPRNGLNNAIVQQQIYRNDTQFTMKTNAFVDFWAVDFTPKFADSTILLTYNLNVGKRETGELQIDYKVFRDGTRVTSLGSNTSGSTGVNDVYRHQVTDTSYGHMPIVWSAIDTPGTTNTINYKMQLSSLSTTYATLYVNFISRGVSSLVIQEIRN